MRRCFHYPSHEKLTILAQWNECNCFEIKHKYTDFVVIQEDTKVSNERNKKYFIANGLLVWNCFRYLRWKSDYSVKTIFMFIYAD